MVPSGVAAAAARHAGAHAGAGCMSRCRPDVACEFHAAYFTFMPGAAPLSGASR